MTTDISQRTVVVLPTDSPTDEVDRWASIGQVVTELSGLYQLAKERRIDLVLVDDDRTDLVRAVAIKVRRFNGLTEIWRLVDNDQYDADQPDYIDGVLPRDAGLDAVSERVDYIYHAKDLLADYGIVARSARMKVVAETVARIAQTDVSVLIVGPSGAGKELVARAVHRTSRRKSRPFVAINCGALAEGVLESELFGHEKGAFTGSVSKREGLFHKADTGTIFLDEIGETPLETQVRLLRVLEDGTYYPVGSSVPQHTDVRVVAATNRDLSEAIADRMFREDLYFRISVVKIILPPLLDRKQDIQPLLDHFWSGHKAMDYTDSALELLMKYDWPGNVRQLKNFAERMVALKPGGGLVETGDVESFMNEQHATARHLPVETGRTVEEAGQELIYRAILQLGNEVRLLRDLITAHLPDQEVPPPRPSPGDPAGVAAHLNMDEMEALMIRKALEQTNGNRKAAAKRLGIGERTLYRKLKKYNLT